MDGMGVWQVATRPLCVRMASNFYQGAKEGESPRRALHKCTVKCMLLQKGAVNYCGCISSIVGAYIRIVGASAPTKRYKITPLVNGATIITIIRGIQGGKKLREHRFLACLE